MVKSCREAMESFTVKSLPELDICVLGALELFSQNPVPELNLGNFRRPLVVGSGNAAATGKILLEEQDAVFADESTYHKKLEAIHDIDGAILISASGGKHAPIIAKDLKERNIPVLLLTCSKDAEAKKYAEKTFVFPKQREPYTYNTSTYMGMMLAKTKEDPEQILEFIKKSIAPKIPKNLGKYRAFFLIVPEEFDSIRDMFLVKFSELFGPEVQGRSFTPEQTKHAKTVVPSDKELFISIGYNNKAFGKKRLNLPLPDNAGYASMMAIGYYVIGRIQSQQKPFFKKNIIAYCKKSSEQFGQNISPIVE